MSNQSLLACAYRFSVKNIISRSKGQSVVASAAYISRSKIKDYQIGQTFDYSKHKSPALATGVIAPTVAPEWATDIEQLWNRVQFVEYRKNAQFARPIELSLPHQLSNQEMVEMLGIYCRNTFVFDGMISHIALHRPESNGDYRNYHAHILLTLRRINEQGFYGNKVREWNQKSLLCSWREKWAILCAERLQALDLTLEAQRWRYGHLTLNQQYIKAVERNDVEYQQACNREPTRHKGFTLCALERKGIHSYVLEDRSIEQSAYEKVKQELITEIEKQNILVKEKIKIKKICKSQHRVLVLDRTRIR
jgi:hypothetical protein